MLFVLKRQGGGFPSFFYGMLATCAVGFDALKRSPLEAGTCPFPEVSRWKFFERKSCFLFRLKDRRMRQEDVSFDGHFCCVAEKRAWSASAPLARQGKTGWKEKGMPVPCCGRYEQGRGGGSLSPSSVPSGISRKENTSALGGWRKSCLTVEVQTGQRGVPVPGRYRYGGGPGTSGGSRPGTRGRRGFGRLFAGCGKTGCVCSGAPCKSALEAHKRRFLRCEGEMRKSHCGPETGPWARR